MAEAVVFLYTHTMSKSQRGSHVLMILILIAVVGIVGVLAWVFISQTKDSKQQDTASTLSEEPDGFIWQQREEGWQATETPPACPDQPMLKAPADLSEVTSVLYPGQVRALTSYKPHGGLRFDNSTDNKITVTSPIDGYVIGGVRHIADGGTEVQYGFTIMNNCGVMTTIGHLRELTPDFQKIADTFPEPTQNSAVQNVNPPVYVKQGEVLATKIGILGDHNTFFDWGVSDYRQQNEASKSPAYQAAHGEGNGKDTTWFAVCWLQDNWLPPEDQATLAALPSGDKSSDYCK